VERSVIRVSIREGSWLAYLASRWLHAPQGVAIVFFRTIHLYATTREQFLTQPKWVRHEVEHVLQYQRETYIGFLFKYVWYSITKGYENNPFEVAAREAENQPEVMQGVVFL
jgi:hypothetical protein